VPVQYRFFGFFRLLLAAMVVVQHGLPSLGPEALRTWLPPLEIGSVAVLLFFVLSGFIVVEAAAMFYERRPVPFLVNRLIRIYPPYIVAVLITAAMIALAERFGGHAAIFALFGAVPEHSVSQVVANLFAIIPFTGKLTGPPGGEPILILAWALRIELVFYAVVAMALAAGTFVNQPAARLLGVAGVSFLAVDAVYFQSLRGSGLEFTPYFVLGTSVYFTVQPASVRRRVLALVLVVASSLMCAFHISGQSLINPNAGYARDLSGQGAFFFTGLAIWLGLIVLPRVWPEFWARFNAVDQRSGELTYPLYLTHMAALLPCVWLLASPGLLAMGVGLGVALMVAALMHQTVETPLLAVRRRVREQNRAFPGAMPAHP
jgi:peptidoglycan/LPS O-acetylase OafA/YrhL